MKLLGNSSQGDVSIQIRETPPSERSLGLPLDYLHYGAALDYFSLVIPRMEREGLNNKTDAIAYLNSLRKLKVAAREEMIDVLRSFCGAGQEQLCFAQLSSAVTPSKRWRR